MGASLTNIDSFGALQKGPDISLPKTRVLFVSPVSEAKGGAERALIELLSNPWLDCALAVPEYGELGIAAERRNVACACYHPTALSSVHRPPRLSQMAAAVVDTFRCALRIRRIARAHSCDLIHTNGLKAHAIGVLLRILFGFQVVVHLHDIPYSKLERMIWRGISLFANRVIVVSSPCWPGTMTKKVFVLPNGVRAVSSLPAPAPKPNNVRLGFVGRYHPHKGLDLLLDWVGAARDAGLDVGLVTRGRPDPDHPLYWPRICDRIKAEGREPYVIDQGWQNGERTYQDIDFLLVPSDIPDPAPLVIPEAMMAGVVVIGFPAGGIPSLIPPGTGSLARSPLEFVAALRTYLQTPGLYEEVRAAAYRHVKVAHDPDVLAQRFASICSALRSTKTKERPASGSAPL